MIALRMNLRAEPIDLDDEDVADESTLYSPLSAMIYPLIVHSHFFTFLQKIQ